MSPGCLPNEIGELERTAVCHAVTSKSPFLNRKDQEPALQWDPSSNGANLEGGLGGEVLRFRRV